MFDRIFDVLFQFLDLFKFWIVIDDFEQGVVLRLGKYERNLDPGFRWMYPFNIDVALTDNVVPRTVNMGSQSLVTADDKTIVLSAIVTAQIRDIRKALLEVEHVNNALTDSCYATIGDLVRYHTWDQIRDPEFADTVTKACRKQAFRYGIEILRVQFADLTPAKALRLLQEA